MERYLLDYDWTVMGPELIVLAAAALLSILDLFMREDHDRRWLGVLGLSAILAAGVFTAMQLGNPPYEILSDTYRVDDFGLTLKLILLAGAALLFLSSLWSLRHDGIRAHGEYYYLMLAALLGGMLMTASADFITLFVGLELLSISSYILVGLRKRRVESSEAAWKFVVMGGVSTAFILYGMSFAYGLTGTTNLYEVQARLADAYGGGYEWFVYLSLLLMLFGFGFKVAAAPFHMWAPDVYQGATTPVTAFLSVVSKTAAIALILRVVLGGYYFLYQNQMEAPWSAQALLFLAAVSMVVGNTVALRQIHTKRMLAYSSVAHAGTMLVPIATLGFLFESLTYYLFAYLFMALGAFTVLTLVEHHTGSEKISAFAGLSRKNPRLAAVMTLFLLSLAGIPVTAGFFGKFYIIAGAVGTQHLWIAALILVTTVISYYYYFGVIRMMYFRQPATPERLRIPLGPGAVLLVTAAGTLALGLMPQWTLDWLATLDWGAAVMPIQPPGS
ncbi:NADH-quinone oxidoreductase subunit N [Desmospora profundinema]|uniref:NADH-quinone oxidoreductase subunit N n=1 Tax=Desmospora profundinema TaxID=1571184 RepID=A0ABU1IL75_9BACL|nr:NADH-quinone oxidoreductase subunit N [Desmospora profundinema]MDR6225530.1 NADH-quinone oxidoreductase subunit N [Desmospora profundinema]